MRKGNKVSDVRKKIPKNAVVIFRITEDEKKAMTKKLKKMRIGAGDVFRPALDSFLES
jgi:hypothetical protein